MRIISKFKDYYDGLQRTDTEGFPLYKRETIEIPNMNRTSSNHIYGYSQFREGVNEYSYVEDFIVGFAGKVYQGFKAHSGNEFITPHLFFYDIDNYIEFLKSIDYLEPQEKFSISNHRSERVIRKNFKNFNYTYYEKYFQEYRVPTFTLIDHKMFLNFPLKNVNFGKVKDPYTAYQDIDMFLGNDLAESNDPDMPVGGDVILAESKGYNKQSFRMESPGKKRKKNKKNKKGE